MTYGFPPGSGGGATAFTELTDAPPQITANALLFGNAAGDAVAFAGSIQVVPGDAETSTAINMTRTDASGCRFYAENYADGDFNYPGSDVTLQAATTDSLLTMYAYDADGHGGAFVLHVQNDGVIEFKNDSSIASTLKLTNFDTPATDTTARLTVDGTSYGIAKAIQVKIGADTHYWPLFGGEDAGPAPSSGGASQLAPVDYLDENFSDFSTGVVDTTAAPYNSTATEGQSVICAYPSTPADAGIWVLGVMTDPAAVPVTRRADALTGATFTKGQVIRVGSSTPPSTFARCLPYDASYTNWQVSGVLGTDTFEFDPGNDSGLYSTASGVGSVANGDYATASGNYATASGQSSLASGSNSTASGQSSLASGANSTAIGDHSIATGNASTARIYGSEAHAAGAFSAAGDAQVGRYVLKCISTNGAPQYALAGSEFITPPNNASFDFSGRLVAREPATKDSKSWKFEGLIKRGADATDMYIVSAVTPVAGDTGASAWTVEVRADDGNLVVVVTGEADKTIQWVCGVNTVETIG